MTPPAVDIRPLTTHAEYRACVALQRETWGANFQDDVPPSILMVAQKIGGVAAGAFDQNGRLLGFVFGMTGIRDGMVVHWSDMLAVRPEAQNRGIARRLKEYQRAAVAKLGARFIYWTYDPLVARNAHLNFNVFGVRVVEYARDMYGDETGSDLHRGIGTDRLVVAWPVNDAELEQCRRAAADARRRADFLNAPVTGDADAADAAPAATGAAGFRRIAVPQDLSLLLAREPARAAQWRARNREAFETSMRDGYVVSGFVMDEQRDRGYYLLARA